MQVKVVCDTCRILKKGYCKKLNYHPKETNKRACVAWNDEDREIKPFLLAEGIYDS